MDKNKHGFTMIEVALFLVITGALFVGIAVGTQNSIFQQRYNDAVQNFAEFLRSAYAQTMNVQSEGDGRSDMAIYGKLVSFGETVDLAGNDIKNTDAVYSYNVIGKVGEMSSGNVLELLSEDQLDANVVVKKDDKFQSVGLVEDYRPRWSAAIQNTDDSSSFKGALLIVRHPSSGTVYTFVMTGTAMDINGKIKQANLEGVSTFNPLTEYLSSFQIKQVDFCINPNGPDEGGLRRDVRVISGARNGSGVEIISEGGGDKCARL